MKLKSLLCFLFIVFAIKQWLITPYIVSSSSMDMTLIKGDYVIVNTWQKLSKNVGEYLSKNDVIAFHYPLEESRIADKTVYIKRCIGLPGDSLRLLKGKEPNNASLPLNFDYLVIDPEKILSWEILSSYGIHLGGKTRSGDWLLNLSKLQINLLQGHSKQLDFTIYNQAQNWFDLSIFPSDTNLHWNRDYYGPIYIPKKGDRISLNPNNIAIYRRIIEKYEGHELHADTNHIAINGIPVEEYVFRNNYYFLIGDNRHHSKDSRNWGFVPENHIIGTCASIVFNIDQFEFDRVFKQL